LLTISLQNVSTNGRDIETANSYRYYSFQVTSPSGFSPSLTAYGTNMFHPIFYRLSGQQLPAGQSYTEYAVLNRLFNMTNTGEYTVAVSRQVPKRQGPYQEVWVRSGPLKIAITKP